MTIYDTLGVPTVINATGTLTRVGGTLMEPEVLDAMREAAGHFVRMEDLQEAAGRLIAEATGAEAGYVTSGASAGLTLAAAACVAGLDVGKMDRLPDTTGMRDEVVVQKAHRNAYDHAVRLAGVRFVEVGTLGFPGGGGTWPWQVADAITDRTAAVLWPLINAAGIVGLEEVCRIAHARNVPVIVDAAAALPPAENLRRFVAEGADVVVFSGGKALLGPQASGILAGRAAIVESIALQQQDMDVFAETWTWRARYLDTGILAGPPHQGIGRGFKVGKEEVVGLMVALKRYLERDHAADHTRWRAMVDHVAAALSEVPGVRVECVYPPATNVPSLHLHVDEDRLGLSALDAINRLADGSPGVLVRQGQAHQGILGIQPMCLRDEELGVVIDRTRAVLSGGR
ncbi:MAG: aminotransferase class V-fold PLP-dependent enzyme [Chloroflexi bacterium]|nr:aminotransferase class V-fold PLP-dependent enzyme [Chloroflexota bacterium]